MGVVMTGQGDKGSDALPHHGRVFVVLGDGGEEVVGGARRGEGGACIVGLMKKGWGGGWGVWGLLVSYGKRTGLGGAGLFGGWVGGEGVRTKVIGVL